MEHRTTIFAGLLAAVQGTVTAGTITVNVAGDPAGMGTCPTTCSLRQAISTAVGGDTLVFKAGLASPINLTQGSLVVDKFLIIQGPGATKLTVSAQNASRVLEVSAQANVSDITLANGEVVGSAGGGAGDSVGGGCVLIASGATLVLDKVTVGHCLVIGGDGGKGSKGSAGSIIGGISNPPGPGGVGGFGGAARGGAILVQGSLALTNSSVVTSSTVGGKGGAGGDGGDPGGTSFFSLGGNGGKGGDATGSAIFADNNANLRIANSTISGGTATGGDGGNASTYMLPGTAGSGGDASGGLIATVYGLTDIEFSTLTNGKVIAGAPGATGEPAQAGIIAGNALQAPGAITVLSSIIVDTQAGATLCNRNVTAASGSVNLSQDTSCPGFTLHASAAQTLRQLNVNDTPWPAFMPAWHGPAIDDAATCTDLAAQIVTSDEHGTPRPQGAQCDLGAIEADYIFVDDF